MYWKSSAVCLISLFLVALLPSLSAGQNVFTSIELKSLPTLPSTVSGNVPLAFGMGFARGDVPQGADVRMSIDSNCDELTSQFVCLRAWSDESCKHGHFAAALTPEQAELVRTQSDANSSLLVHLNSYPDEAITTGPSLQDAIDRLTNMGASALVAIDEFGTVYNSELSLALNTSVRMSGPVMTEIVARGVPSTPPPRVPHPRLEFEMVIRVWHDADYADFDVVFENIQTTLSPTDSDRAGDITPINSDHTYDVDFDVGSYSFTQSGLVHYFATRWRRHQMWPLTDAASSVFLVVPNMRYLSYAQLLPAYDYENRPAPTQAERDSAWSSFQSSDTDLLGIGVMAPAMPSTGDRQDIGLLPEWTARYIFDPYDYRMFDIMMFQSTAGGAWEVHLTSNIEEEPKLTSNGQAYGRQIVNQFNSPYTLDCAHQPSMHYVPYLLTAEKFSADELLHWSNYAMFKANPGPSNTTEYSSNRYRAWEIGYIVETPRGTAWCLRNIHHTAEILPLDAGNPAGTRDKYEAVVEANLQTWADDMVPLSEFGFFGHSWLTMAARYEPACLNATYSLVSPWQDDFFVLVMNHWMSDNPSEAYAIFTPWLSNYVIGRFQERSDWDRSYGAPYRLAAEILDNNTGQPRLVESWEEIWQYSYGGNYEAQDGPYAYPPIDGLGDCGSVNPTSCTLCYPYGARAAVRLVLANVLAGRYETVDDAEEAARYLTENLSGNEPAFKISTADTPPPCPQLQQVCEADPQPCNNDPNAGASEAATMEWMMSL